MPDTFQAIIWGGVLCGVLDGTATTLLCWWKGIKPLSLWQSVASGLLGPAAFKRGWRTGAAGLLLHFLIAFAAASVFCVASGRFPFLMRRPLVYGTLYGTLVYVAMNFMVVPLSRMPKGRLTLGAVITQWVVHMLFVGLPISFSAYFFTL